MRRGSIAGDGEAEEKLFEFGDWDDGCGLGDGSSKAGNRGEEEGERLTNSL